MPAFIPIDVNRVRALARLGWTDREIGMELGVTDQKVFWTRHRHGIQRNLNTTGPRRDFRPINAERVRGLAAAGWTDEKIAAALLGPTRGAKLRVWRVRARLGIAPGVPKNSTTHQLQIAAAKDAGRRAMCRKYGLPDGLTRQQVAILLVLCEGALTLPALSMKLWGMPKGRSAYNHPTIKGNNLLGNLLLRGLVATNQNYTRGGPRGHNRLANTYMLTMTAMNMLAFPKEHQ